MRDEKIRAIGLNALLTFSFKNNKKGKKQTKTRIE